MLFWLLSAYLAYLPTSNQIHVLFCVSFPYQTYLEEVLRPCDHVHLARVGVYMSEFRILNEVSGTPNPNAAVR